MSCACGRSSWHSLVGIGGRLDDKLSISPTGVGLGLGAGGTAPGLPRLAIEGVVEGAAWVP